MTHESYHNSKYHDAMYTSSYASHVWGGVFVLSLVLAVFDLVAFLIFNGQNMQAETMQTVRLACGSIGGACVLIAVVSLILNLVANRNSRVCLAIYPEHMYISTSPKSKTAMKQVLYSSITKYIFDREYSLHSNDSVSRHRYNYGTLKIRVGTTEYETYIENIEKTREILSPLLKIKESFKKDW